MRARLYYDGACPLCRAEMTRLGRRSGAPQLCDIQTLTTEALPRPREQLLRQLHLQNEQGELVTGLDANLQAWYLGGARFWPWLLRLPVIQGCSRWLYRCWADRRYRHRYGKRS